jgi:hypothetical protein
MPQPLSALPSAARGVIGAISSAAAASSHTAAAATTAAEDHTLQLGDLATICLGYSGVCVCIRLRLQRTVTASTVSVIACIECSVKLVQLVALHSVTAW